MSVAPPTGARAFRVALAGAPYWTVVDERYAVVEVADAFLRDLRVGRARAESTTRLYAGEVALFLRWCDEHGRSLEEGLRQLGRFLLWLRTAPIERAGRGHGAPRGPARINHVLSVIRELARHAADRGTISGEVLGALYQLPLPEQPGERGPWGAPARPVHRVRARRRGHPRLASVEEWEALLGAARSWRDRFLLGLLWYSGMRVGEALGLRRSDLHLAPSSLALGCDLEGPHLHVEPRSNPNGAAAKGGPRSVPAHRYVVALYDRYLEEREACHEADGCDFVFVNLFARPLGAPMRLDTVNALFHALSRRAGLERAVTPHMLRHAAGTALAEQGTAAEVIAELLGHADLRSTQIYLHASEGRKREAVERLAGLRRPTLPAPGRGR